MKRKPCGRPIQVGPPSTTRAGVCTYERMPGKQQCIWHWLTRQPADVQKYHAERRRELAIGQAEEQARARVPKEEWPDGERWCAGCQSFVPLFYCSGSRCKSCASSAAHERRVETTYGIPAERYDEILKQQGGRCAICRNRPRTMRLAVDHDHKTGEVRGLLCKRCNHDLLGGGHDDVLMLYRAIEYLLYPPAGSEATPQTIDQVLRTLHIRLLQIAQRNAPKPREAPKPPPF